MGNRGPGAGGRIMTSRLRVHHVSRYAYDHEIGASYNEARVTPLNTSWQQTLESVLRVEESTWQHSYRDYWGTRVKVFEAHRPHRMLIVDAFSVVEVDGTRMPQGDETMTWDTLRSGAIGDRFGEYLAQTTYTVPDQELAEQADRLAASGSPHETALALCSLAHERITYLPGSTGVYTAGRDAWRSGAGVCQDYAHIVVGALRHVGLPARYVSGYLHPNRSPAIGVSATGESHAWVEWWLGQWTGHDPTNDVSIGERHVLVGRGRDYSDVPPIKGLVAGSSGIADLQVKVEVTRLA
jgi:transglutaminase-like putative cysteine protease